MESSVKAALLSPSRTYNVTEKHPRPGSFG